MRKFALVNMLLAFVLILGSCATNNNVVSNKLISKRKYTKGFHINKKSHHKDSKGDVAYEEASVESSKKTEKKVKVNREAKKQLKNEISVSSEAIAFAEVEEHTVEYAESFEENGMTLDGVFDADFSIEENAEVTNESDSSENESHSEVAKSSKKASGGGRGDLMYILILILLILAIIALLSLVGGVIGQILGLVVLILIIYFLLKLLGVI